MSSKNAHTQQNSEMANAKLLFFNPSRVHTTHPLIVTFGVHGWLQHYTVSKQPHVAHLLNIVSIATAYCIR